MINPFQDAPEDLCRRILHIWDELYDGEIAAFADKPLTSQLVTMLEVRVHMARIAKSMGPSVFGSASWTAPSAGLFKPAPGAPVLGTAPTSMRDFGPVTITYTAQETGTPRSGRIWRRPRGSAR